MTLIKHPFHHYPSSWVAFLAWGMAGFMGHPTIAGMVVWFVMAALLLIALGMAHHEGKKMR